MTILSAAVLLFLVIDPLGNVPFFLCVLKNVEAGRRRAIILRELGIAFGILVLFLFGGRYLLLLLRVSEPSLSMAGGIILFIIAIRMIFLGSEKVFEDLLRGEPFIVPLAIPSIAGPSSLATVLLLMAREPSRWLEWLIALAAACFVSGVILLLFGPAHQPAGRKGAGGDGTADGDDPDDGGRRNVSLSAEETLSLIPVSL